jgi:hypothetical protein
VVAYDGGVHDGFDVAGAMNRLRLLAEQKDELFFTRRGFAGSRDFLKQYSRLSAAWFRGPAGTPNVLWLNPIGKHRLPPELRTILQRLDGTG